MRLRRALPGGQNPRVDTRRKTTGWLTVFRLIGLGRLSVGLAVKCFTVYNCIELRLYTDRVRVLPAANAGVTERKLAQW